MSPAPFSIAALSFLLAYEVSCRARTGSVRRSKQCAQRFAPCLLWNRGSPACPAVRGTSSFGRRL